MFSKEEAAKIRKLFWVSYGKSFPRKWLLYKTKIKGFEFKFAADRKTAMVCLDIDSADSVKNELLFEQIKSLETLIRENYLPEVVFDPSFQLETGKSIFRIYVAHTEKFSIYNKATWLSAYVFFNETMPQFELLFYEFEDSIKSAIY